MKLTNFRVYNFRSVEDSGWIEVGSVSALIGTNESGKTNLLVPLWKLKPAKGGEIKPTIDFPRKRYNEIRAMERKPRFIRAQFELSEAEVQTVVGLTGAAIEDVSTVEVSRSFDGRYTVDFLSSGDATLDSNNIQELLSSAESDLNSFNIEPGESTQHDAAIKAIKAAKERITSDKLDGNSFKNAIADLEEIKRKRKAPQNLISARLKQLFSKLKDLAESLDRPNPSENAEARKFIVKAMPSFVYYSNYGNLDSEIYLPHVIENMNRDDLGSKEEAKSRTLKVLFEFVNLQPTEILELGRDIQRDDDRPDDDEVSAVAEKKKERDILLQSASTELTTRFRDWWKQGEYRFRFQADGDHFRIWVSDDKRPEDIELEGRSTGLQWFLSFYLIFLVESRDSHEGSVLLLDEPGLSLHPLAQRDLSKFFENLAKTNQILYTTHSPFLVDPDHLDRVKAVYVGEDGCTLVSSDLRASEKLAAQSRSIYPVYAALGLSISETLLQGCQVIIVEGTSDQFSLSAMKAYLVGHGLIAPRRELVFIPAGGVRGITAVVSIVSGPSESMPFIILDNDTAGREMAKRLRTNLYASAGEKVVLLEKDGLSDVELEDLWPTRFLAESANRILRGPDEDFSDTVKSNESFVDQVEAFAEKHNLILSESWKVELAKIAKAKLLRNPDAVAIESNEAKTWQELFKNLIQ